MKTCAKFSCYKEGVYKIGLGNNTYIYTCDDHISAFIPDYIVTVHYLPEEKEIQIDNAEPQEDS